MLSDADVERWSRQIVLPEVGGRGQERLCAARAAVRGVGPAAVLAAQLVGRAGVSLAAGREDVVLDLGDEPADACPQGILVRGRVHGARVAVATLVGRPCGACLAPEILAPVTAGGEPAAGVLAAPAALVLGALAAGEALRALLARPRAGRLQTVDLGAGVFGGTALAASPGCARCAANR